MVFFDIYCVKAQEKLKKVVIPKALSQFLKLGIPKWKNQRPYP
jgi:hypothetical protein